MGRCGLPFFFTRVTYRVSLFDLLFVSLFCILYTFYSRAYYPGYLSTFPFFLLPD